MHPRLVYGRCSWYYQTASPLSENVRNKTYRNTYSKIIRESLNTMEINHKWNIAKPICPFCYTSNEDWRHVIWCNQQGRSALRERCIQDFFAILDSYETYPPLAELLLEFISNKNFEPEEPLIGNPRYCLPFHYVFRSQKNIGWENFSRDIVSEKWKSIQYIYIVYRSKRKIFTQLIRGLECSSNK